MMTRFRVSHHRSAWLSVLLGLALTVGSLLPASLVFGQEGPAQASGSAPDNVLAPDAVIGGVNLGNLTNYLLVFTDGRTDANWQGATKGFVGDAAIDGIQADERTSGGVPYAGTIYTNDATLDAWQDIVDQNAPPDVSPAQAFGVTGETARINGLTADLVSAFQQINALAATAGYTGVSSTSLNGLNTQSNGVCDRYVINVTSGLQVSSKINITGDACDVFVLRWDEDANFADGYEGDVKFQSGGAIVPLGGLKPSNFVHVAGDINSSGGGSTPAAPYPQGPRFDDGTGALCDGCANFSGGGFFTGYWLTTGSPDNFDAGTGLWYGETASLSNGIFVGGWYSLTSQFSMTSGTSGVYVSPNPATEADWGDAPDTYGTLLASNGPSHALTPGLTLGAVIDAEDNGQPTVDATGDDLNETPNDEDALPFGLNVYGPSPSVDVEVTNTYLTGNPLAGQPAYLQCWLDLDGNGSFDANEASGVVTIPANSGVTIHTMTFDPMATGVDDTYLRCRLSLTEAEVANPTGAATSGEVEDHASFVDYDVNPFDWGDLPSTRYPTLLSQDGARHSVMSALFLGACVDAETDGQEQADATGDDTNQAGNPVALRGSCSNGDDEDGVFKAAGLGGSAWQLGLLGGGLQITIGGLIGGVPQVFMDFDQNNTLDAMQLYYDDDNNPGTPVVAYAGAALPAGTYTFYFDIPTNVNLQTPVATRVRLSNAGGLAPTGVSPNGEIEDYFFNNDPPLAVNLAVFEAVAQAGHVLVSWETVSELDNAGFNLYRSLAADGEFTLLAYLPSQAPGSTVGASYSYQDADVQAGQTYWYRLEAIDVNGAATLFDPVSVTFVGPTAVTLSSVEASPAAASSLPLAGALLALLLAPVGAAWARRRA